MSLSPLLAMMPWKNPMVLAHLRPENVADIDAFHASVPRKGSIRSDEVGSQLKPGNPPNRTAGPIAIAGIGIRIVASRRAHDAGLVLLPDILESTSIHPAHPWMPAGLPESQLPDGATGRDPPPHWQCRRRVKPCTTVGKWKKEWVWNMDIRWSVGPRRLGYPPPNSSPGHLLSH